MLKPNNFCKFCFEKLLKQLLDYQNSCCEYYVVPSHYMIEFTYIVQPYSVAMVQNNYKVFMCVIKTQLSIALRSDTVATCT